MLTPKEAATKFVSFKPDSVAETISDWYDGKSYFISNSKGNDFVDECYLINKETGKIESLDFLDYVNTIQDLSEDEIDNPKYKKWKIKYL